MVSQTMCTEARYCTPHHINFCFYINCIAITILIMRALA